MKGPKVTLRSSANRIRHTARLTQSLNDAPQKVDTQSNPASASYGAASDKGKRGCLKDVLSSPGGPSGDGQSTLPQDTWQRQETHQANPGPPSPSGRPVQQPIRGATQGPGRHRWAARPARQPAAPQTRLAVDQHSRQGIGTRSSHRSDMQLGPAAGVPDQHTRQQILWQCTNCGRSILENEACTACGRQQLCQSTSALRGKAAVSTEPKPLQSRRQKGAPRKATLPAVPIDITIPNEVTVSQLSQLLGVAASKVEDSLAELGKAPTSREDQVTYTDAELVAMAFGRTVSQSSTAMGQDKDAVSRPAVVTIMGHVDHGKTTLLDSLRKTAVAAGEAGGITQHMGAFQVTLPGSGGVITFLDTPGHAAFSAMRARGAAVTDIVTLVVAADDGVKPQTREALMHARASGCPIVVALTKCDVPGSDPARAKQQLAELDLELEDFGGDVQVVETAALRGHGLQQLEEALLFQAELMNLKASPTRPAVGVVVEARMDKGQGPIATLIVKQGTLQIGQNLVLGLQYGKVRAMRDHSGQALKEARPGQPVEISGLRGMPMAGDSFMVQRSEDVARRLSEARQLRKEQTWITNTKTSSSLGSSVDEPGNDSEPIVRQLGIVIKADTQGSAEALAASVEALSSSAVVVKTLQCGVGPVSMSDVDSAVSLGAKILAFNVKSPAAVESHAKQLDVQVQRHTIIYHLIHEVGLWMAALAPRVEQEMVLGEASVVQTFPVRGQAATHIAGCRVSSGTVNADKTFRVLRAGDILWEGSASSLKRLKQDVLQVGKGTDCGILLNGFSSFQPGDILRCLTVQLVPQTMESVVTHMRS